MSADKERADALKKSCEHFDANQAQALDDNGRKDASRAGVKTSMEITRISGAKARGK